MAQQRGHSSYKTVGTDYNTALGVRGNPYLIGFTVKHFVEGPHAIEGMITTDINRNGNVTFTGLYEYNLKVFQDLPEWSLFFGGGLHFGVYDRWDFNRDRFYKKGDGSYVTGGIDGIIGVSYTFKKLPINLSADLKPYVNFSGPTKYMAEQMGGVAARYTFK
ncbi:hypothetical protein DCM91_12935 [Chitinophaga costaii]|nr:hypothetical protein DCM91_12935 [Chitinophaga costaii]